MADGWRGGLKRLLPLGYSLDMHRPLPSSRLPAAAVTPSPRTRHTELLRLCARIGYSPPSAA